MTVGNTGYVNNTHLYKRKLNALDGLHTCLEDVEVTEIMHTRNVISSSATSWKAECGNHALFLLYYCLEAI